MITTHSSESSGERIAKVLARAGVGSRREVERMIAEGRIALRGKTVATPATLVAGIEGLSVDGTPVAAPERPRLWRYHKPRGLVTTSRDPGGRPTVFGALPPELPRVISVGRLDINTEGLLLLTNDGGLARWMELPATGWKRRYRVRVHGSVDEAALKGLARGGTVGGVRYAPITARLERAQGSNAWIEVILSEGKYREVRTVMESLGLKVTRLIRTSFGPFELGGLKRGAVAEIAEAAIRASVPTEVLGGPGPTPAAKAKAPARKGRAPSHRSGKPGKTDKGEKAGRGEKAARGGKDGKTRKVRKIHKGGAR